MKKKTKQYLLGGILAAALAIGLGLYLSHCAHPVEPDMRNLEACVLDRYNRGHQAALTPAVRLHAPVILGEDAFVLLDIGDDLGSVHLRRGLGGRWKLGWLSYGGGNFCHSIEEADGGQYLLFGGRNLLPAIRRIGFTLDGLSYEMEVPEGDRFLVYTALDRPTEETHLDLEHLCFYNAEGRDITEEVDWNGRP